eukprot:TRINITY_DN16869_c0_g1_i1.p1 TRINITY_DN16869_c0_g1~~TRINITY_DN16869_c0_g1_i1.p1  ORF type:complete len:699 (+),score=152.48 TRINITY_DN16869_c0_g1_i1:69-2099(+)
MGCAAGKPSGKGVAARTGSQPSTPSPNSAEKAKHGALTLHPLSPACRSVQWFSIYSKSPIVIDIVDSKPDIQSDGQPRLTEADFTLTESYAILQYMADGHDIFPKDKKSLTLMNEYFAFHYAQVRKITLECTKHVFADSEKQEKVTAGFESIKSILTALDARLGKSDYAVGSALSLADFLLCPEIDQLSFKRLDLLGADFPNITKYIERMKSVDGYQQTWDAAVIAADKNISPKNTGSGKMTLRGHPISQPARSVQWFIDFAGIENCEVKFTDVAAGEHKKPEFLEKHPNGEIPVLEHGDFNLSQSHAILMYLAEGTPLSPDKLDKKQLSKLNEYIGNHHSVIRKFSTQVFRPGVFGNAREQAEENFKGMKATFDSLNEKLGKQKFIIGDELSLADFLFAPELDQLQLLSMLKDYSNLSAYLERLREVKGYTACWEGAQATVKQYKGATDTAATPAAESSGGSKIKLNGHPLSQPSRSVQWYISYSKKPVEVNMIDLMAGGHKTPEYLAKHPQGQVPTLEDGDFFLSQSSAILQYLAEDDKTVMPDSTDKKAMAKVKEYFGTHHANVRSCTAQCFSKFVFSKPEDKEKDIKSGYETIKPLLQKFDDVLGKQEYILGDKLSIADFLFAPEVDQLHMIDVLDTSLTNIHKYLDRLSSVEGYNACRDGAKETVEALKAR